LSSDSLNSPNNVVDPTGEIFGLDDAAELYVSGIIISAAYGGAAGAFAAYMSGHSVLVGIGVGLAVGAFTGATGGIWAGPAAAAADLAVQYANGGHPFSSGGLTEAIAVGLFGQGSDTFAGAVAAHAGDQGLSIVAQVIGNGISTVGGGLAEGINAELGDQSPQATPVSPPIPTSQGSLQQNNNGGGSQPSPQPPTPTVPTAGQGLDLAAPGEGPIEPCIR